MHSHFRRPLSPFGRLPFFYDRRRPGLNTRRRNREYKSEEDNIVMRGTSRMRVISYEFLFFFFFLGGYGQNFKNRLFQKNYHPTIPDYSRGRDFEQYSCSGAFIANFKAFTAGVILSDRLSHTVRTCCVTRESPDLIIPSEERVVRLKSCALVTLRFHRKRDFSTHYDHPAEIFNDHCNANTLYIQNYFYLLFVEPYGSLYTFIFYFQRTRGRVKSSRSLIVFE